MRCFHWLISLFCVSFLMAGALSGEENDSQQVLLLRSPRVSENFSTLCLKFMKANLRGPVREDRTLLSVDGFTPQEQLKAFSAMRSKSDAIVIVLDSSAATDVSPISYSESLGCAVVNIASVVRDLDLSDLAREARVEKSIMYAIGRLVGMAPCLNPLCALSEYETVQKDRLPGRNFCPNCCDKVAAGLADRGVRENSESMVTTGER